MSQNEPYEVIMEVFRTTNPDGTRFYTPAEIRHFLPLMVFMTGGKISEWPENVRHLVAETLVAAGVDATTAPDKVPELINAYYEANPPHPQLVTSMVAAFKKAGSLQEAGKKKLGEFLGNAAASGVLGGGERPAGTFAGGMAARLSTAAPSKKK